MFKYDVPSYRSSATMLDFLLEMWKNLLSAFETGFASTAFSNVDRTLGAMTALCATSNASAIYRTKEGSTLHSNGDELAEGASRNNPPGERV